VYCTVQLLHAQQSDEKEPVVERDVGMFSCAIFAEGGAQFCVRSRLQLSVPLHRPAGTQARQMATFLPNQSNSLLTLDIKCGFYCVLRDLSLLFIFLFARTCQVLKHLFAMIVGGLQFHYNFQETVL